MRLIDVTLWNLSRRKGRKLLLMAGLSIGVATVVALVAITTTMQSDVAAKLDEYGANILIVPKANDLSLSYGGVAVASAAYDVGELTEADLDRIKTIKNARNISVVAPKLLGAMPIEDQTVLVAGVRFDDELRLKQWWDMEGSEPGARDEVLAFVQGEALQAEQFASNMWGRSITSAPQLTYYWLGYREVWSLFEDVQAARGDAFDLREFMDGMMADGPVPVRHYRETMLFEHSP